MHCIRKKDNIPQHSLLFYSVLLRWLFSTESMVKVLTVCSPAWLSGRCHFACLKLAMVGVFTPWTCTGTTDEGFTFLSCQLAGNIFIGMSMFTLHSDFDLYLVFQRIVTFVSAWPPLLTFEFYNLIVDATIAT